MRRKPVIALLVAVLAAWWLAGSAFAALPTIDSMSPLAGQRGTDFDVSFHGPRIKDAVDVLFYTPGISITHVAAAKDGSVLAHFAIAKDARVGEYALRLRTATGLSNIRTFWVGPYKVVEDTGRTGNRTAARAMPIDMNVGVIGRVQEDATNFYKVQAKKGQRLSVEVIGMRLGLTEFDPYLQILGADGKSPLLTCDDTVFALADPVATMIAPYDGTYYLSVRDSAFNAPRDSQYLMYVGRFPRPTVTFPLGGQPGTSLPIKFLDDAAGPIGQTIAIPADAPPTMDIFAEQEGLSSPTPNDLCIDSCANFLSNDINHSTASAMPIAGNMPVALNGIIAKPRQHDFYRITVKARVPLDVKVFARQLRSPLDSVLCIYDDKGHPFMRNDDEPGTPDSYLRFTPPSNGQFIIGIEDQLGRGGADYAYRIEVTPALPMVTTSLQIPNFEKTALLQTVAVPRNNRIATVVRLIRNDYDGPLRLSAPDLPRGVKMIANPVLAGESTVVVIFEADKDAPLAGALCQLQADPLDPKVHFTGTFHFGFNVLEFNNAALHQVQTDRLAIAVTDPAPVSIRVDPPKIALLQDATMDLHIHVDRPAGFKERLRLQAALYPRGLQPQRVDVPPGVSDVIMHVAAEPNTPIGIARMCVRASFEDNGAMLVASDFVPIDVQESPLQIHLPSLSVAAGTTTTVSCPVDQQTPIAGSATVQLLGLPQGCTADDVTLNAADKQLQFKIHADPTCRPGNQQSVFVRLSYTKAGEPIVLNLGRGTTIRVTSARRGPPLASASGRGVK